MLVVGGISNRPATGNGNPDNPSDGEPASLRCKGAHLKDLSGDGADAKNAKKCEW